MTRSRRAGMIAAAVLATAAGLSLAGVSVAHAATDTVTNCNDSGTGSLRDTVASAGAGDTINFNLSPSCDLITLTSTLDITQSLTITGPGAPALAVSGGGLVGILSISPGAMVGISGLTLENGAALNGGGIFNSGIMTLTDSTVSGNSAPGNLGGGGGIENNGSMTLTDSTVSGNSAAAGGGIRSDGTATLAATIVADNTAGNGTGDCLANSPMSSLGYNLTDDPNGASAASCGFTATGDVVGAEPNLGPLASNGGPTLTMVPAAGSPAVQAIPPGTTLNGVSVCPRADQRGVASTLGGRCTIGAVEVPAPAQAATSTTAGNVTTVYSASGQNVTLSATVSSTSTVNAGAVTFTVVNSSNQVVSTGTLGTVSNGAASASLPLPAGLAAGTYTIEAAYSGSADFLASSGNGTLTVDQPPSITSGPTATFVVGSDGSFTVQATGFPGGPGISFTESGSLPMGVSFTDNGDGTATLAGTPAKGDKAAAYALVITASNGVSPAAVQDFTLVVKYPTTVKVLVFPVPAVVGVPVLAIAVLSAGDWHGTISFTESFDGGPAVPVPGCQNVPVFFNSAACLFTPARSAGPGTYTVTASYSGDASYIAAAGSASVAALARTFLALAASSSPRAGSPLTVTAQVAPVPDGGTVSFQVTGPNGKNITLPASCTAAPVGTGTVSCTFTPAARGIYHVSAVYSGDALYFRSAAFLQVKAS
jgi:Bacterial Ig-like domain (group 3)